MENSKTATPPPKTKKKPRSALSVPELEFAVAKHLCWRRNIIVPNVFWGLGFNYEVDLLSVTPRGWATEIEIKTSIADLRRDLKKRHLHDDPRIQKLIFALPYAMAEFVVEVPARAGVMLVKTLNKVELVRAPTINRNGRSFTPQELTKLRDLATMRVWNLKLALMNAKSGGKSK